MDFNDYYSVTVNADLIGLFDKYGNFEVAFYKGYASDPYGLDEDEHLSVLAAWKVFMSSDIAPTLVSPPGLSAWQ